MSSKGIFFSTILTIVLFAILFKSVRNMSHEKLIFERCKAAGLPVALCLLIVAQSKHETAIKGIPYMSKQFITNNNAFGYGFVKGNPLQLGSGGKHPEDGGVYAKYANLTKSVDDIIGWYKRRQSTFFSVTTISNFAALLKSSSYFTDSSANYAGGVKRFFKNEIV